MKSKLCLLGVLSVISLSAFETKAGIIPRPTNLTIDKNNDSLLPSEWNVTISPERKDDFEQFQEVLSQWDDSIRFFQSCNSPNPNFRLRYKPNMSKESYMLVVDSSDKSPIVTLEYGDYAGGLYGMLSFLKLIKEAQDNGGKMYDTIIQDAPALDWRGVMLDVSRHFFRVDEVKKLLDAMALFKLNVLHLHLTDGPGWRFEVEKYPLLTELGAWRYPDQGEWNWQGLKFPKKLGEQGANYGGFYTKKDLRELLSYADQRGIKIVPEIDVPGHSFAAMLAYPELRCEPNDFENKGQKGQDALCVGRPESLKMVQAALDELMSVLPKGSTIHLGGDEVAPTTWKTCKHCQDMMKRHNLSSEKDLQSVWLQELCNYVKGHGYRPMVWDECLEMKPLDDVDVMIWRDKKLMAKAKSQNKKVVLSPCSDLYFDYYQADPQTEPKAIGGYIPLEQVYRFTIPDGDDKSTVLGMQGNTWTEYMKDWSHVSYMIWPRGIALAERAWVGNDKNSDYEEFQKRMNEYLQLMEEKDYNFKKPESYRGIKNDGLFK